MTLHGARGAPQELALSSTLLTLVFLESLDFCPNTLKNYLTVSLLLVLKGMALLANEGAPRELPFSQINKMHVLEPYDWFQQSLKNFFTKFESDVIVVSPPLWLMGMTLFDDHGVPHELTSHTSQSSINLCSNHLICFNTS